MTLPDGAQFFAFFNHCNYKAESFFQVNVLLFISFIRFNMMQIFALIHKKSNLHIFLYSPTIHVFNAQNFFTSRQHVLVNSSKLNEFVAHKQVNGKVSQTNNKTNVTYRNVYVAFISHTHRLVNRSIYQIIH